MGELSLAAVVGLALVTALAAVFLRDSRLPVLSLLAVVAGGAVILLRLLPGLKTLLDCLGQLTPGLEGADPYIELLLKMIALAYLAELGAQLCRDAGQGSLALKVELAAKLSIAVLALPIFGAVASSVLSLLG